MKEVLIIGVDLAKQIFQLHGATSEGEAVFRKKLSRKQFAAFMQKHPGCIVAMEACATAHHWARTLSALGHAVRLIPEVRQAVCEEPEKRHGGCKGYRGGTQCQNLLILTG